MGRIFLISYVFFALLTATYAGEIYTYTDEDGKTVITNEPVPEKYENKAKKMDSYQGDSSEEIQRREDETRQKQQYQQQTQQQKLEQQKNEKAGLKCYTKQDTSGVGGGIVSPNGVPLGGVMLPGATWYICKDKNGKIVSKKKL